MAPPETREEQEARQRRGVRKTAITVAVIALLIYIGFVMGLIGR